MNQPMDPFIQAAIEEARQGLAEGGIPIGSVLVIDGAIVGRGHNRRVQRGSAILHAEMDCLENAGRLRAAGQTRSAWQRRPVARGGESRFRVAAPRRWLPAAAA